MSLDDINKELNLHIKRINALLPEIENWLPLKPEDFTNIEKVKTIDSFIYRFIKLQDKIGEKFFPVTLDILQEYKDNMSLLDVLNKLEKLELIDSVDEWIDFRKLRNSLTHDYPDNEEELIEALNMALGAYKKIVDSYLKINKFLKSRKHL